MVVTKSGYSSDWGGYDRLFTWTKSVTRPGLWWLMNHMDVEKSGYAVTDDFGNLVEVS